jgi:hypothetical protein
MGLLAELPALPPVIAPKAIDAPLVTESLKLVDSHCPSHFSIPVDPPPRRA